MEVRSALHTELEGAWAQKPLRHARKQARMPVNLEVSSVVHTLAYPELHLMLVLQGVCCMVQNAITVLLSLAVTQSSELKPPGPGCKERGELFSLAVGSEKAHSQPVGESAEDAPHAQECSQNVTGHCDEYL